MRFFVPAARAVVLAALAVAPFVSLSLPAAAAASSYADAQVPVVIGNVECFVVRCPDVDTLVSLSERLEGQLTATLQMEPADAGIARQLIPILERKCGRIMANGWPTGVAVVSDLMRVAREIRSGSPERVSPFAHERLGENKPVDITVQKRAYYLRFRVEDRPGIIATLAGILASKHISLEAVPLP